MYCHRIVESIDHRPQDEPLALGQPVLQPEYFTGALYCSRIGIKIRSTRRVDYTNGNCHDISPAIMVDIGRDGHITAVRSGKHMGRKGRWVRAEVLVP